MQRLGPYRRGSKGRRRFVQASRDHLIESGEILSFAQGQTAVDLHERVKPGAADQQGRNRRHTPTGILRKLPFPGKASADHLTEIAAPQTRLEIQIFGRLAVENLLQQIDRGFTEVEAPAMVIPSDANGLLGVSAHHGSEGGEVAFCQLRFMHVHFWLSLRQAIAYSVLMSGLVTLPHRAV
jgi:hypothetical protein